MKRLAIALAIWASFALVPRADAARDLGKELALAFVVGCLKALPELERIESTATANEWKPLGQEAAQLLAPAEPDENLKGWLVDRAPAPPYLMAISSRVFRGEDMAICMISNPYAPVDAVIPHLEKVLGLSSPITDESSAGERNRVWRIDVDQVPAFVTLSDSELLGQPGFILSGLMKAKE